MSRDWYLYMLQTRRGTLYTGITTDVERRCAEHEAGRGAKALRGKGPLVLMHWEWVGDHGKALRLEASIKRLSALEKRRWLAARSSADAVR
ncbi:GIY-YIG nuclease family protein [Larsenimonas salina]|uniref:GIY-YIG nuclease family protein n=1 Tax=Larsenimonas salina TaxID=1295565 RepID=UPI0032F066A8